MDETKRQSHSSPSLENIQSLLRTHLPEIQERYDVAFLGIFGSYVKGRQKRRSDLDVLVEFGSRKPTLFEFIGLEIYLSELLGIKVDLVMKNVLKPHIGRHILSEVLAV